MIFRHADDDCFHGKHGACHDGWVVRKPKPDLFADKPADYRLKYHLQMAGYLIGVVQSWKDAYKQAKTREDRLSALLQACHYEYSRVQHIRKAQALQSCTL